MHYCHEHPLGGERRRYWCGHWCDDPPCRAATFAYRVRLVFGRSDSVDPWWASASRLTRIITAIQIWWAWRRAARELAIFNRVYEELEFPTGVYIESGRRWAPTPNSEDDTNG